MKRWAVDKLEEIWVLIKIIIIKCCRIAIICQSKIFHSFKHWKMVRIFSPHFEKGIVFNARVKRFVHNFRSMFYINFITRAGGVCYCCYCWLQQQFGSMCFNPFCNMENWNYAIHFSSSSASPSLSWSFVVIDCCYCCRCRLFAKSFILMRHFI